MNSVKLINEGKQVVKSTMSRTEGKFVKPDVTMPTPIAQEAKKAVTAVKSEVAYTRPDGQTFNVVV